jgi:hypothetical protein
MGGLPRSPRTVAILLPRRDFAGGKPQFFICEGFDIDGTEFNVRLDFGWRTAAWADKNKGPYRRSVEA